MFSRIISPLTAKANRGLLFSNKLCFSKHLEVASKLRSQVEHQIGYEEQQIEDLSKYTNFFENEGWAINYNDIQVELTKNMGKHDVRILFNAKTPMNTPPEEEGQQNEEEGGIDENFQQISVFVKRQGVNKWMCADFFHMNEQSQVNNIYFTSNYDKEKELKAGGRMGGVGTGSGYLGPDLSSLEQSLEQGVLEFVESFGVKPQMMDKISEFSIAYEQKFYLQWLKDLNSIV